MGIQFLIYDFLTRTYFQERNYGVKQWLAVYHFLIFGLTPFGQLWSISLTPTYYLIS